MRIFYIVTALMVLVTMSCRSVPDSVMLRSFQQDRPALDELARMATADNLSCPVPASGKAECLPAARVAQYQILLRSAHVFGVSPQRNHGYILFPSVQESALLAIHTHSRGYAYALGSSLLPSTKETRNEVGEKPMAFRQINGPWYLYFSA
jgi:hypothetical protein